MPPRETGSAANVRVKVVPVADQAGFVAKESAYADSAARSIPASARQNAAVFIADRVEPRNSDIAVPMNAARAKSKMAPKMSAERSAEPRLVWCMCAGLALAITELEKGRTKRVAAAVHELALLPSGLLGNQIEFDGAYLVFVRRGIGAERT